MNTPVMQAPPPPPKGPPGTKNMLMGPPGSGKTHALGTLAEVPGLKTFIIFTEPSGTTMMTHSDKFHWAYVPAAPGNLTSFIAKSEKLNTFSRSALLKMENVDAQNYKQGIELAKVLFTLKCDVCGQSFGPPDKLDTSWCIGLDSLTPVNEMALDLVAGGKPMVHEGDYGAAIDWEKDFIDLLTKGLRCHIVVIAHTTRETDEVHGGSRVLPNALGKKYPQIIGQPFDDIAVASLDGNNFQWSTQAAGVDAKARRLPLAKSLKPTFVPIFEKWKSQGGII